MFCYCYYVHNATITTKNNLIFIPALPSLHNCHENEITIRLPWEKYCSIFSHRKFTVSERFAHDTVASPSGTSVDSEYFFSQELQWFYKFCTWCTGFTANNFSGVLHFLLPYNNAYESKETSWKHFILFYKQ